MPRAHKVSRALYLVIKQGKPHVMLLREELGYFVREGIRRIHPVTNLVDRLTEIGVSLVDLKKSIDSREQQIAQLKIYTSEIISLSEPLLWQLRKITDGYTLVNKVKSDIDSYCHNKTQEIKYWQEATLGSSMWESTKGSACNGALGNVEYKLIEICEKTNAESKDFYNSVLFDNCECKQEKRGIFGIEHKCTVQASIICKTKKTRIPRFCNDVAKDCNSTVFAQHKIDRKVCSSIKDQGKYFECVTNLKIGKSKELRRCLGMRLGCATRRDVTL